MRIGERRDLRQVGDDNHLRGSRQPREPATHFDGCSPADTGVHLVEDECGNRVRASENDLDGQHHAGQFATGRSPLQWSRRCAGMRGQQELHIVDAVRAEGDRRPATSSPSASIRCVTETDSSACGMASERSSRVTARRIASPRPGRRR